MHLRSEGWGEGQGFRGTLHPGCLAPPGVEDSTSRLEERG